MLVIIGNLETATSELSQLLFVNFKKIFYLKLLLFEEKIMDKDIIHVLFDSEERKFCNDVNHVSC